MLRGDEAFARGEIAEALAEYRLALRQGDASAPILARAAHAYTATGRISEAVEHYREAVALDPELADLAASDSSSSPERPSGRETGFRPPRPFRLPW